MNLQTLSLCQDRASCDLCWNLHTCLILNDDWITQEGWYLAVVWCLMIIMVKQKSVSYNGTTSIQSFPRTIRPKSVWGCLIFAPSQADGPFWGDLLGFDLAHTCFLILLFKMHCGSSRLTDYQQCGYQADQIHVRKEEAVTCLWHQRFQSSC